MKNKQKTKLIGFWQLLLAIAILIMALIIASYEVQLSQTRVIKIMPCTKTASSSGLPVVKCGK